ncbi:DUF3421 domain-containing protein [Rhodotorula toruloides]|uniref:Uncharacterized protein n=1 Tax=Rhodotorula toruloides TaxID=5286 RepID=A0A0K3CCV3_RHOTO|nr:DUF3421 domain-containing protein [Rhodotorula toruloides]PRQ75499.1 hypothetical protein AAT19DRAFT_13556 [Rhodotorula toruloides]
MSSPPAYTQSVPAAGLRVPCSSAQAFPDPSLTGPAPFRDLDGSPVFVCSVLMAGKSVHPAKVTHGKAMYSYGGVEKHHEGRFDILPITEAMEWVPTSYGQIPPGRRPVEGGFEEGGQHLFHAIMTIDGVRVPGKTGEHLHGANFPFGGGEIVQEAGYSILCWR